MTTSCGFSFSDVSIKNSFPMLIIVVILLIAAAVITYFSTTYGTALAFLAMCVAGLMSDVVIMPPTYVFWAIAMLVVIALNFMLPPKVVKSKLGIHYIYTAALAGMLAGLAISHAAMIVGAVAAAVLGGVAFARTSEGEGLGFPTRKFWNYFCAKALPAIISFCIIGTTIPLLVR